MHIRARQYNIVFDCNSGIQIALHGLKFFRALCNGIIHMLTIAVSLFEIPLMPSLNFLTAYQALIPALHLEQVDAGITNHDAIVFGSCKPGAFWKR